MSASVSGTPDCCLDVDLGDGFVVLVRRLLDDDEEEEESSEEEDNVGDSKGRPGDPSTVD